MSNLLSEVHPELVLEWSERNLPLTPDKITYGSNKIVWWIGTCGHEWQTSVKARSSGEKCPICSGARAVEGINDLVTLKPELAAEWSSKNNPLKPTMVTVGSHKKVIWKGKCGHEWTATVKSRAISGTGCPYCSHNKVLEGFNDLASQRPLIASEWSERNYPLKPNMVTVFANRKVWWKCSKGHEWNTLISTRSGGSQCPYCSGQILLKGFNDFATTHPQLAQEWSDRNLPLTPDMINEKSRKNVWWKCRECGNEWQSVVYARISLEGFEVAVRLTGSAAKNIAILLASVLKQEISQSNKTRGKARLTNMIKSGKELKVFSFQQKDLPKFTEQAKRYGVLYCVLRDKNTKSDTAMVDIIARAEDAAKIQRISDRFELGKVDKASIVSEAEKDVADREAAANEVPARSRGEIIVEEAMGKPIQKEGNSHQNPSVAKTDKSPLSERDSETTGTHTDKGVAKAADKKPSVREKLDRYKAAAKAEKEAERTVPEASKEKPKTPEANRQTVHRQPKKSKKPKER